MGARDLIVEHLKTRHAELVVPPGWAKSAIRQLHAQEHNRPGADHAHPDAGNAFERFAEENLIEGAA